MDLRLGIRTGSAGSISVHTARHVLTLSGSEGIFIGNHDDLLGSAPYACGGHHDMPTIKWCGNKPWDTDFPEHPLPDHATPIDRPEDIWKASLPYGILPLAICYAFIALKWFGMRECAVNPFFVPIGIALGFLLMPVHEFLHAICYSKGQTVYIGICLKKVAAFAVCHEAISRTRFILMSIMPVLLGLIPLTIFMLCPANGMISGLCIPSGILGMLSPMPDYMDIHIVCRQTPKGSLIQTQNNGFYWF